MVRITASTWPDEGDGWRYTPYQPSLGERIAIKSWEAIPAGLRRLLLIEINPYTLEIRVPEEVVNCTKPDTPDSSWNLSGVGGCFIATAVYGSDDHPNVKHLREFRYAVLMETGWGRKLVDLYYRHSPDIACYIADHDMARMIARTLLAPVVLVIAYPWLTALACIALMAMLYLLLRRARLKSTAR